MCFLKAVFLAPTEELRSICILECSCRSALLTVSATTKYKLAFQVFVPAASEQCDSKNFIVIFLKFRFAVLPALVSYERVSFQLNSFDRQFGQLSPISFSGLLNACLLTEQSKIHLFLQVCHSRGFVRAGQVLKVATCAPPECRSRPSLNQML